MIYSRLSACFTKGVTIIETFNVIEQPLAGDAIVHGFMSCCLASKLGAEEAKEAMELHEQHHSPAAPGPEGSPEHRAWQRHPGETAMDLWNNLMGYAIGESMRSGKQGSESCLLNVLKAAEAGHLIQMEHLDGATPTISKLTLSASSDCPIYPTILWRSCSDVSGSLSALRSTAELISLHRQGESLARLGRCRLQTGLASLLGDSVLELTVIVTRYAF